MAGRTSRTLLMILFLTLLSTAAHSFTFLQPWGYVWLNGAHYKTNLESEKFDSDLTRIEAKLGVDLFPLWAGAKLQPYFAYYGVSSADRHSWNNNEVSGFGVQVMPLLGMNEMGWLQDLKIFYESLTINWTSQDEDTPWDKPEDNHETDTRFGMEIWHEWNQPGQYTVENRRMLWGELWTNLSHRTTNFGSVWEDDFDTYLFYFQPRVGVYLFKLFNSISLEPYFKMDAVASGKDVTYYNNVAYGIGLRVRPFMAGYFFGLDLRVLRKLKLFIETLSVSYLRERGEIDHDLRFGVDFNIGR